MRREACGGNTGKRAEGIQGSVLGAQQNFLSQGAVDGGGDAGFRRGRRAMSEVMNSSRCWLLGDNQVLTLARRNGLRYPPGFRLQASASE